MADFFTADPHFGHRNIIRYCDRPFSDVDHMDAELVRRWNEVVTPDDDVWVLGDVALGDIERSLGQIKLLNGTKHLVSGNHDRCWSGSKKYAAWVERYHEAGFATIDEEVRLFVEEFPVVLSHFPYQGDHHGRERYDIYRPKDTGEWLIHGHVHGAWKVAGRQINAGVDVWNFAPVPAGVLANIMRTEAA